MSSVKSAYLCSLQSDWFEFCLCGLAERLLVWSMRSHHTVQTGSPRQKSTFLCLILTINQPHKLTHAVSCIVTWQSHDTAWVWLTVVPGWSEGAFLHTPARGKDDKISNGHSRLSAGTSQDSIDGGILGYKWEVKVRRKQSGTTYWMINWYRIDDHKSTQIILVRIIVTMPTNHIKGGVVLQRDEDLD